MSGNRHITTLTDSSFSRSNVNSRFIVNIHFERLTQSYTTARISNHNGERIRIVVCRDPSLSIVVVINTTSNAVTLLIVLIPSISQSRIIVTVNPSNQVDIVNTCFFVRSEVANIMVTRNRNDRVTFHEDNVRSNESRFATFNTEINVSLILIRKGILIQNSHLFVESRSINARHQDTVFIPNITKRSVNIDIASLFVDDISGKINTFAFTDSKCVSHCSRNRMSLIGSQNLLQLDRKHKDGILTPDCTLSSSLSNIDHQNFAGVNVSLINTGSTVRNQSGVTRNLVDFIPLINQIIHVVIAKVSCSSNQAAFANSVMIDRNSHSNISTNINIVRLASSNTTVLIGNSQCEDVRMILSTEVGSQSIIINGELIVNAINRNVSISNSISSIQILVVQTPLIIIIMIACSCIGGVVNQSNQTYKAVITNNRVASDLDSRIVQNENIRLDSRVFGLTTVQADGNDAISVRTRSSRHNADGIQVLTRNFKTVFVPNIMICVICISNQNSLSAQTDGIFTFNLSSRDCDRLNGHINRVSTCTLTNRR